MQLNLEDLDAGGLDLSFGADPARQKRITLGPTQGLRGILMQTPEVLQVSDAAAESMVVSFLQLMFENFAVALRAEGSLLDVAGNCQRNASSMDLHLDARALHAPELMLTFGTFRASGNLRAENVRVHIGSSHSQVRAETLEIDGLQLAGKATLGVEHLLAKNIDVAWGEGGYAAQAGELLVSRASVGIDLAASAPAEGEQDAQDRAAPSARGKPGLIDWSMLDGLSGSLDVDVLVDMKIPVLGARRARHPFRIMIESGSLNYRELERNLSALEDSTLDFAVRDGALVLERGLPLLPTRGRGKPIFSWPLSPEDLALANEHRVRLAVLPTGRPAASEEGKQSNGNGPSIVLRELGFAEVQALLRLEPIQTSVAPIRRLSLEDLFVRGSVHHRAEGAQPGGGLAGQLRGLRGTVAQLPLGANRVDIGDLHVGPLTHLKVPFRGIHPQKVAFELADLHASSLRVENRP
jgi:hypothetical protein